jgi:uncharacterized protein YigE (DUF2233 family)
MQKTTSGRLGLCAIGWLLAGCAVQASPSAGSVAPSSVESSTGTAPRSIHQTAIPTAASTQSIKDSGWETLRAGLERRRIDLQGAEPEAAEEITILRIDPAEFSFDVAYDPQGKDLEAWQSATGAEVIVNGGYFRREQGEFVPDGLIVSGGEAFGVSYGEYAGMFAVGDGGPELRWLKTKPYDPAEKLRSALQSFPMLIKPGGETGFPAESDDGIRARRTVVGQDRGGRVLFLIASRESFTLRALSVYLHDSDLGLDIAMNLDGGPSSGLMLASPREVVPAQTVLPIVLVVRAK